MNEKQRWLKLLEIISYLVSQNGIYSDTLVKMTDELQVLIEEME